MRVAVSFLFAFIISSYAIGSMLPDADEAVPNDELVQQLPRIRFQHATAYKPDAGEVMEDLFQEDASSKSRGREAATEQKHKQTDEELFSLLQQKATPQAELLQVEFQHAASKPDAGEVMEDLFQEGANKKFAERKAETEHGHKQTDEELFSLLQQESQEKSTAHKKKKKSRKGPKHGQKAKKGHKGRKGHKKKGESEIKLPKGKSPDRCRYPFVYPYQRRRRCNKYVARATPAMMLQEPVGYDAPHRHPKLVATSKPQPGKVLTSASWRPFKRSWRHSRRRRHSRWRKMSRKQRRAMWLKRFKRMAHHHKRFLKKMWLKRKQMRKKGRAMWLKRIKAMKSGRGWVHGTRKRIPWLKRMRKLKQMRPRNRSFGHHKWKRYRRFRSQHKRRHNAKSSAKSAPKKKKMAPRKPKGGKRASQARRWVKAINALRCLHDVPKVVWNDDVAASAQAWADKGVYHHSKSYKIPPPAGPAGENIAMGQDSLEAAVHDWYNEVKDCGPMPGCIDGKRGVVGHFTAMVWKGVKEIGCGVGKIKNPRPNTPPIFYVCRFKADDAVNMNTPNMRMPGAYKQNVLPVKRTAKQCGIKKKKFTNQLPGCIKKQTLGKCAKCLKNEQCKPPMYCCPYMKRCVGRGTRCMWPVANCQPMCYDFKSNAECGCKNKDFPQKWQKNTCKK